MGKFNTMFDVAFAVEHDCEDPENVPVADLIAALQQRVNYLRTHPSDAVDAFGVCDTYSTGDEEHDDVDDEASDALDALNESHIKMACQHVGHEKILVRYATEQPINDRAHIGQCQFLGPKRKNKYISKVVQSPTWLEVAVLCNEMLLSVKAGDMVFLEDIDKLPDKDQNVSGVTLFTFGLGS